MILDSYFAYAAFVLLGLVILLVTSNIRLGKHNERLISMGREQMGELAVARYDLKAARADIKLWQEAYEARDAQLAEARAQLAQASKNDHRDAKGRFARADRLEAGYRASASA